MSTSVYIPLPQVWRAAWAVKAQQTFRDRAKSLALALGTHSANLRAEIRELCQRIITFGPKTKRKKHLSTFSKLLAAETLEIYQLYPLA